MKKQFFRRWVTGRTDLSERKRTRCMLVSYWGHREMDPENNDVTRQKIYHQNRSGNWNLQVNGS